MKVILEEALLILVIVAFIGGVDIAVKSAAIYLTLLIIVFLLNGYSKTK